MDKLRKFGEILWYSKERLVFATMLVILCWYVYRLVNAPVDAAQNVYAYPLQEPGPDFKAPLPPIPPEPKMPQSWKEAYTPNPFWYYAVPAGSNRPGGGETETGITLRQIQQMPDGTLRAEIETMAPKWYNQGDKFESYTLLKIDPASKSCEVYSERLGKNIVLTQVGN